MSNENIKQLLEKQKVAVKELMGFDPINPPGECFDNTAKESLNWFKYGLLDAKIIHAQGISGAPGQEGKAIAHAWVEYLGEAYDCTWGIKAPIEDYRRGLKASNIHEYGLLEYYRLLKKHDYSGPWAPELKEITDAKR